MPRAETVNGLQILMLAPFGIRPKGTLLARMLPLAQELVLRGHRVRIVAPPVLNPEDAGRSEVIGGVPVVHTAVPRLAGPAGVFEQALALARPALTEPTDLVHLFKPKGYGGLAALLVRAIRPRLPLVVDTDDWEGWGGWNDLLPYPRAAKALFAWQERDLPRRAAAVTVASRTLESLVWSMGVAPDRVFYVPNGISFDSDCIQPINQGSAGFTVLLYTRFWELDVQDIIAAMVAILARQPLTRLLVIGRGERGEEHELLRLAGRAGIAAAIDYRGWMEPAEIPGMFRQADVALVPMNDTLINRARCSAKLLELLAAGLPVVASRVGQVAEYIYDGESGLLVAPGDAGGLARGVLALLDDLDLRKRLGAGARHAAARFAWERLAPAVEQAYRRVY